MGTVRTIFSGEVDNFWIEIWDFVDDKGLHSLQIYDAKNRNRTLVSINLTPKQVEIIASSFLKTLSPLKNLTLRLQEEK